MDLTSIPLAGEEKENAKDTVKENILGILKEEYGIEEEDFLSAEIEVVPAVEAIPVVYWFIEFTTNSIFPPETT